MNKDLIDIFNVQYNAKGEKLITDNYTLADGTYIMVNTDGNIKYQKEFDKKVNQIIEFEEFITRDYLSKYLESNKSIEKSKLIHSNNYMSFFIKKETLNLEEFAKKKKKANIKEFILECIDDYFNVLENPKNKYSKKKEALKLYKEIEEQLGLSNVEKVNYCRNWIKENIFQIGENLKDYKGYLKIFFDFPIEEYEKESNRYIIPNIYNSNDYNTEFNGEILGLPNNNMGMNSKKPYLANKTRKNNMPYLINKEDVLIQKKFYDYLYNLVNNGVNNVYFDITNKIIKPLYKDEETKRHKEKVEKGLRAYYLRIQKGKEVEIHDFDIITNYNTEITALEIKEEIVNENIRVKSKLLENGGKKVTSIYSLEKLVDRIYFNKFLVNNYFTPIKDLKINDSKVLEQMALTKDAWFSFIYKGNVNQIKSMFKKSSMELIKNSIANGYVVKAFEQFVLREAILDYFELNKDRKVSNIDGGRRMGDFIKPINDKLRQKINIKEKDIRENRVTQGVIESDEEYYFAVGQFISYLFSLSKANTKKQSLINPFLNCKSDKKLKELLERLYKKYNHAIEGNYGRASSLNRMIIGYIPKESKVKTDILIAGYLYSSLIYEESKDNKENNKKDEK
ncbi:type I-B CRISPR-associated protein Cas8b/Csh1 [Sarcina sp. JB2]|uniref:Type I-B CRISPR-associated protein Cas8b/Csh1 n=1 Tax=Candidatus Sarcina troglodytae TaxID=2726954 RepID=A0ACD1BCR0_9CLOT|nr:type I-B CRISPR-associated protein Cas8b/Csh1 [Sarcina sp. JB2]QPJ85198.1 type I-B CRISPR-associated protein Cas8b/Csh1 [Sarcina sp. JB2]